MEEVKAKALLRSGLLDEHPIQRPLTILALPDIVYKMRCT